jgi:hypothetical protein
MQASPVDPKTGQLAGKPQRLIDSVAISVARGHVFFDIAEGGLVTWRPPPSSLPTWRMRWLDHHGNVTGSLGEAGAIMDLALSPDETKVAASQGYPQRQVWIYNVQTGTSSRASSLSGDERFPRWSPDGRILYYTHRSDQARRIIRQPIGAGSEPETLYEESVDRSIALHAATPDGAHLILTCRGIGNNDSGLFQLDLRNNGNKRSELELLMRMEPSEVDGIELGLSPNGQWLVYRVRENRRYAIPYPPLGAQARPAGRFSRPFFSPDGATLYGYDGRYIVSQRVLSGEKDRLQLGEPTILFASLGTQSASTQIAAASRDGKRILTITTDQPEAVATQILNDWTTLLR